MGVNGSNFDYRTASNAEPPAQRAAYRPAVSQLESLRRRRDGYVVNPRRDSLEVPVNLQDLQQERRLVERACGGDRRAFEQLYRLHVARVYGLCLRLSGDAGRAEELTQDVFVRAWQRLHSFRGASRLASWLHRLTVNLACSALRSLSRHQERFTNSDQLDHAEERRPTSTGTAVDLERAISALPARAREVFVLHDMQGYQHKEISELTGVAVGTSKAQLHRARRLLRESLTS